MHFESMEAISAKCDGCDPFRARRAEGLVFFNYSVMAGSLPQFSHELS